ncbi:MATE family efflux transporter [Rothia sp. P13129]|uniref:MATE family efflux transporter n=1 Tax=Rothia sp. P13129 TaxID=3402664 RepID=UPI003AD085DB
MSATRPAPSNTLHRQILHLAIPAFGALVAEPLFVMADSAMIGHLGTDKLAGLTLGSTIIQTVIGLMVFLSYSTTPAVARAYGKNNLSQAYAAGRNALWVALGLGALLGILGWVFSQQLFTALGADTATTINAQEYLHPSLLGLPAMLGVLAIVGVLRGLQDTKTPLYVATVGAIVNIVLDWVMIYLLGWGLAGSAIATATVQWGMFAVLSVSLWRGITRYGVQLAPELSGLRHVFALGSWLMLRSLSMRVALLGTVIVATHQGQTALATYQLTMSFFSFLAFALDSLAIAAQALLGKELGAQNLNTAQGKNAVLDFKNALVRWSLYFGVITGIFCALIGFTSSWIFSSDPHVQHLFALSLLVVGLTQPLAAYVFVLDGVLMGAEDMRYLGIASLIVLGAYVPSLLLVDVLTPLMGQSAAFIALWLAYSTVFMGARAVTLGRRARTEIWVR